MTPDGIIDRVHGYGSNLGDRPHDTWGTSDGREPWSPSEDRSRSRRGRVDPPHGCLGHGGQRRKTETKVPRLDPPESLRHRRVSVATWMGGCRVKLLLHYRRPLRSRVK